MLNWWCITWPVGYLITLSPSCLALFYLTVILRIFPSLWKWIGHCVCLTSMSHSVLIFCTSVPIFRYAVLRIITLNLSLWYYSTTLCRMYCIFCTLCYIKPAVLWTRRIVWCPTGNHEGSVDTGRDFACRSDLRYRLWGDCDAMATTIYPYMYTHTHIYLYIYIFVPKRDEVTRELR